MAETITKEQIQQEVQEEVKEVIIESMQVVKQYVDENSIKNEAERNALKKEIADAIAQKYDFENEKEKLDRASEVADTLLGLFDANEDSKIDPQEFLDKLNSIYSQLETTNKLSEDLQGLAAQVADLKTYIDTKIGEVNGKIDTLNTAVSKSQADITAIEANLSTNYFTKEEVQVVLSINKDEIVNEVRNIFYPASDDNGDGATL